MDRRIKNAGGRSTGIHTQFDTAPVDKYHAMKLIL